MHDYRHTRTHTYMHTPLLTGRCSLIPVDPNRDPLSCASGLCTQYTGLEVCPLDKHTHTHTHTHTPSISRIQICTCKKAQTCSYTVHPEMHMHTCMHSCNTVCPNTCKHTLPHAHSCTHWLCRICRIYMHRYTMS